MKHNINASSTEVGEQCNIHLLHIGNRKYCEFKELTDNSAGDVSKLDAKQLLMKFAEKRLAKSHFVPRETRSSTKPKPTPSVPDDPNITKTSRGKCTSTRPTRDASKGVNYLELNEGLSPPRTK